MQKSSRIHELSDSDRSRVSSAAPYSAPIETFSLTPFDSIDPSVYADWYLGSCYPQIPYHDEKVILEFLVSQTPTIGSADRLLELGCGPVVSHVLPFEPYVRSMILADYLDSNLEQVRLWLERKPRAFDWSNHTACVLKLEGSEPTGAAIRAREESIRSKTELLTVCDIRKQPALALTDQFDVVSCFYATEQAASTRSEWLEVIRNLGAHVAPGGRLFLSCVRETEHYVIHDRERVPLRIPIVPVTYDLMIDGFRSAGFDCERSVFKSVDILGLEEDGLNGVLLVNALKAPF